MGRAPHRLVYLVRHGRTALNADGRLRGHLDPPLDDRGLQEVGNLGAAFASLSERPLRIVTGPLTRTRQTATAIASLCGAEITVDPRLVDRDYGRWAGELADDLQLRFGADLAYLPGAESLAHVEDRAQAVLDEQVEPSPRGPVVLVAHDAVNRLLLHTLAPNDGPADTIEQRTACWNAIECTSTGWQVQTVNGDAESLRRIQDGVGNDATD